MKGLKTVLWICAISWLLEFSFTPLPWRAITAYSNWVGYQLPAAEPINVFMVRLYLAMFGMIGIFFIILARNPLKYGAMLLLAAYGSLCYGVFLLVCGIRYALPIKMYAVDFIFLFIAGVLILIFRKRAIQSSTA